MKTESAKGRSKVYFYYNCSSAQKGTGCSHRRISAHELDQWLLDNILSKVLTPARMLDVVTEVETLGSKWVEEHDLRIRSAQAELKKVKFEQDKILEVIQNFGMASPGLPALLSKLDAFTIQEQQLNKTLQELASFEDDLSPISRKDVLEATNELINIIKSCEDPKRVRTLLQYFVEKIVLNKETVEVFYRPERLINEKNYEQMVRSSESWLPDQGSNLGPAD